MWEKTWNFCCAGVVVGFTRVEKWYETGEGVRTRAGGRPRSKTAGEVCTIVRGRRIGGYGASYGDSVPEKMTLLKNCFLELLLSSIVCLGKRMWQCCEVLQDADKEVYIGTRKRK
jgi:hypothetical protein